MRLLHTSDWHLGRALKGVSLVEHQRAFLSDLADLVRARDIQAVLVSGDIYDRAIPPIEAVTLFADALLELSRQCPVIAIPGNHDSATRLGFGAPLLAPAGVHMIAGVEQCEHPVRIQSDDAQVLVYAIPYLEPELVFRELQCERSHASVLTAVMDRIRADISRQRRESIRIGRPDPYVVIMAHAFITGGGPSDSEKDVSVGGIADAPVDVFLGADYVALGHLHGPQQITSPGTMIAHYSGSPLPYSFSEEKHVKSVTVVQFTAEGHVSVEVVPTQLARRLRTITGTLDELLSDPDLGDAEDDWIRAILLDVIRPDHAMERLQTRFPNAIELVLMDQQFESLTIDNLPAADDPLAITTAFIEHVTGQSATTQEVDHIRAVIEDLRISDAQR